MPNRAHCPSCGSASLARLRRKSLRDRLLGMFRLYPYKCDTCAHRFNARGRKSKSAT